MTSMDDIRKALAAEKIKMRSGAVNPEPPTLDDIDLLAWMTNNANPGAGQQDLTKDKSIGGHKAGVSEAELVSQLATAFDIPGLKEAMDQEKNKIK
tara:strand:- start:9743 stop:10030 length:288 start_codon:yes stop_codon:yes gene_type:complete